MFKDVREDEKKEFRVWSIYGILEKLQVYVIANIVNDINRLRFIILYF